MSLFDALKKKDNPYSLPLLTAGLTILAKNRGETSGTPAILAGLQAGLGSYKDQNEQREKDEMKANMQAALKAYQANTGQMGGNLYTPPQAGDTVQALTNLNTRSASPAFGAAQPETPQTVGPQASPMAGTPGMQANPYAATQAQGANHSALRELITGLSLAGMTPDNIHQVLPVLAKSMPDYQAQNLMVRGQDGQAQPMMINSHGNTTMLPYNIAGKQHAVDLGGQSLMVDEYTGQPTTAFAKSISPDVQLKSNTAYGVAGMNNRNAMDIANLNNQTRLTVGEMRAKNAAQTNAKANADSDRLFRAVDAEISRMEEAVKEGYTGTGVIADAATSMPFLGKHLRGFTDPRTQKVAGSINALRGIMTKLVHGGRASNQDMEQISRMLFIAENDSPEEKTWALKRLRVYLNNLEMNGPVSSSQQPTPAEIEDDIDFSGWGMQ